MKTNGLTKEIRLPVIMLESFRKVKKSDPLMSLQDLAINSEEYRTSMSVCEYDFSVDIGDDKWWLPR